jgi:hypothetical protein
MKTLAAIVLNLAIVSLSQAAVLTVTSTVDDGSPGCLRWCIEHAEPGDEIQFDPSLDGQPIELGAPLNIDKTLTIRGRGVDNTILSGGRGYYAGGIFNSGELTLTDIRVRNCSAAEGAGGILNTGELTLTNSAVSNSRGGYGVGGIGNGGELTLTNSTVDDNSGLLVGGIYNVGTMTVETATVRNNKAECCWGVMYGRTGGIYNGGGMTIIDSAVTGNIGGGEVCGRPGHCGDVSARGAGIRNEGDLMIVNSTISNNRATRGGEGGGILNEATLTIHNSTLSDNRAYDGRRQKGKGGGIRNDAAGVLRISSSTIADNRADLGGNIDNLGEVVVGNSVVAGLCRDTAIVQSLGHNLDSDSSCGFDQPSDLSGQDPLLGPLQDNGGPTWTHVPLEGSPIIDRGWCDPGTDQRGVPRPIDGNRDNVWLCDIGAVEYVPYCDGPDRPCDGKEYEVIGPLGRPIVIFF